MNTQTDVVMLGGGLAAMTLALQLKQDRPATEITILEKQSFPVDEAAYKVGESTIEVAAHYFTKVLGLEQALRPAKLPKLGLRYFFNTGDNKPVEQRAEVGQAYYPVTHTYNFDRGRMENILHRLCLEAGVQFHDRTRVLDVELGAGDHRVTYKTGEETYTMDASWVIDASGRAALLKRKLDLRESNDHNVNAVWFRLDKEIAVDDYSNDPAWRARVPFGLRKLSTNHMMGAGYWVWLIPLASGSISIGIVADERLHPLSEMNKFDKALAWLRKHEPQLADMVEAHQDTLQDFLALRHFSHGCKQVFSADGWALTGEAGAFLDPFYSPGSDFIAFSNGFINALVKADLDGEDIEARAVQYDQMYLNLYRTYLLLYQDQYPMMSNAQVYGAKIVWDFGIYWASTGLLYFQQKLHDLTYMQKVLPTLLQFFQLNEQVQRLFREWHERDDASWARDVFVNYLEVGFLYNWQTDLTKPFCEASLTERLDVNLRICENFVAWLVRRASGTLDKLTLDDPEIDPYNVSLHDFPTDPTPVEERHLNMVEELNHLIDQVYRDARQNAGTLVAA